MDQMAIAKYLAQGLTQEQVAAIVGCTPSYISQLVAQDDIKELVEVEQKRIQAEKENTQEEQEYSGLEKKARVYLSDNMPFAEYKDVLKLLEILNRRKEKPVPQMINNTQINVTRLSVPAAAMPEFVVNAQNEIIGIGEKSLAPMSSAGVREMFTNIKEKAQKELANKGKEKEIDDITAIVDLDKQERAGTVETGAGT